MHKFRIVHKTMVDPLKMLLDASLSQIMGNEMSLCSVVFSISVAMMSSLLNIEWRLGWLHFLSRDARRCSRRCLHSNSKSIICIAFWGLSQTIQTALHCPCP